MPVKYRVKQQGFTLTELIIIMIIMGVLMATAAPRFMGTQTFESRGFYDEVLSSLRYAQKIAVGTGCPIQFTITTGPDSYGMTRGTACENGNFIGGVPIINPRTGADYPTAAPADVVFSNVVGFPIEFTSFGRAINTGGTPLVSPTATVNVGTRTITIWAETGLVQ